MKNSFSKLTVCVLTSLLMACGSGDDNKGGHSPDGQTAAASVADDHAANGNTLVASNVAAPAGFTFDRKDLEGIGTMEMPTGKDWSVEDNTFYNEALDMTVKIQSQEANNLDIVKEYTQSYAENNHRDAKGFVETKREEGQVNGYVATMLAGKFNNGQPYVTKDYLFFTPEKSVVLQVRVNEKDKDKLEPLVDYMASSLKK